MPIEYKAGQRVFITKEEPDSDWAFATEDFYGSTLSRFNGTVVGRYDRTKYKIDRDNGEQSILDVTEFEAVDQPPSLLFGPVGLATIGAVLAVLLIGWAI